MFGDKYCTYCGRLIPGKPVIDEPHYRERWRRRVACDRKECKLAYSRQKARIQWKKSPPKRYLLATELVKLRIDKALFKAIKLEADRKKLYVTHEIRNLLIKAYGGVENEKE
jgi:hypothetical protein